MYTPMWSLASQSYIRFACIVFKRRRAFGGERVFVRCTMFGKIYVCDSMWKPLAAAAAAGADAAAAAYGNNKYAIGARSPYIVEVDVCTVAGGRSETRPA